MFKYLFPFNNVLYLFLFRNRIQLKYVFQSRNRIQSKFVFHSRIPSKYRSELPCHSRILFKYL
jgi:hypothetical protein